MKIKAFGAIDLLISILIMAVAFMIGMNAFRGVNLPLQPQGNDLKSVQEHINDQISEIEDARQKAAEFEKEMQNEFK